ncbi:MAG: hypothetical protein KA715_12605 [Xanthomonadaceae bacterium]|nr:hypothetical protein [Xanthomonadaceae bacterium]
MNLFKLTLFYFLAFTQTTLAQHKAVCNIPEPGLVLKTNIEGSPNYFFRAFPDSDKVAYNGDGTNFVMNMKTGEKFSVPGSYDPVPLFDSKTLTTSSDIGFYFYPVHSNKETTKEEVNLFDKDLKGTYQSVGEIQKINSISKYRIIVVGSEFKQISYAEYLADSSTTPSRINRTKLKNGLCAEKDLKLPMISKDGQYLAARENNASPPRTKIYRITAEDTCEEILDLGLATGKVDFSFDGRKIVFHIDTLQSVDYFNDAGDSTVGNMNVFEMDLKSKKIKQLTYSSNGHSYFPSYRRDGKIVFIRNTGEEDSTEKYSFILVDPKKIKGLQIDEQPPLSTELNCDANQQKDALSAIGQAWYKICAKADTSHEQGFILGANLSREKCLDLVQNYSDSIQLPTSWKLEKKELIKLCGGMSQAKSNKTQPTIKKIVSAKQDPVSIFNSKCAVCHNDNEPFKDPEALKKWPAKLTKGAKTWKDALPMRLKSKDEAFRMPKGGELTQDQINTLLNYID